MLCWVIHILLRYHVTIDWSLDRLQHSLSLLVAAQMHPVTCICAEFASERLQIMQNYIKFHLRFTQQSNNI